MLHALQLLLQLLLLMWCGFPLLLMLLLMLLLLLLLLRCRHRAVPKLMHGTQRYSQMGHTSENEGSTRRNTEEALNGSDEAAP